MLFCVGSNELYSQRKERREREEQGVPEVYRYEIPEPLRYQLLAIAGFHSPFTWFRIASTLILEHGLRPLRPDPPTDHSGRDWCEKFVLTSEPDNVLDFVEVAFENINPKHREHSEINERFRQHRCGYRFENGKVLRLDSEYLHTEATVPTLRLVGEAGFEGPEKEFREAHESYLHQKGRDALVAANRAFESTMKAICIERGWPFDPNSQAKQLIKVVLDKNLLPSYLQSQFTGIRTTLESGIPTLRNRRGGHGQGKDAQPEPPDWLVAYALHITASAIVMLVRAHREA